MSTFDPSRKVGMAYAMNGMSNYLLGGPRSDTVLVEVRKALGA